VHRYLLLANFYDAMTVERTGSPHNDCITDHIPEHGCVHDSGAWARLETLMCACRHSRGDEWPSVLAEVRKLYDQPARCAARSSRHHNYNQLTFC
jgi:hypothetical protein